MVTDFLCANYTGRRVVRLAYEAVGSGRSPSGVGHIPIRIVTLCKRNISAGIGQLTHAPQRIAEVIFRGRIYLRDPAIAIEVICGTVAEDLGQASIEIKNVLSPILCETVAKPVVGVGFRVIDQDQPIGEIVDIGVHAIAQQIWLSRY